jgi:hypothetical protein
VTVTLLPIHTKFSAKSIHQVKNLLRIVYLTMQKIGGKTMYGKKKKKKKGSSKSKKPKKAKKY